MNCPKCNSLLIGTVMTRKPNAEQVIRRKKCKDCAHAWYTLEVPVPGFVVAHSRTPEGRSMFSLRHGYTTVTLS